MSYDITNHIDEYSREVYGHSHWGYLSTYTKEELDAEDHTIEGNIVFWKDDFKEEEI